MGLGRFFQRAFAATRAIWAFLALVRAVARAVPPLRPNSTAAAFFPKDAGLSSVVSAISPVAIRMTWTALEITSAGRL